MSETATASARTRRQRAPRAGCSRPSRGQPATGRRATRPAASADRPDGDPRPEPVHCLSVRSRSSSTSALSSSGSNGFLTNSVAPASNAARRSLSAHARRRRRPGRGEAWIAADMLDHVEPGRAGHHHVEQDEIGMEALDELDRLGAAGGLGERVVRIEREPHQLAQLGSSSQIRIAAPLGHRLRCRAGRARTRAPAAHRDRSRSGCPGRCRRSRCRRPRRARRRAARRSRR